MPDSKNGPSVLKKSMLKNTGLALLVLLAVLLLWFNNATSKQSVGATAAKLRFIGEYRIGDGPWQEITEDGHISSTKGDVTLKGNLHLYTPDDEYIGVFGEKFHVAFYTDHINLTFIEGEKFRYSIDHENPLLGASACGIGWTPYSFMSDGTQPVEIVVHNPHRFGNENAIDEMLSRVALWGNIDFEKDIMSKGKFQRNTGLVLAVIAFVLLGSALFSALINIQDTRIIALLGLIILSAGVYLAYSSTGVSFWSDYISVNTTILGLSMMFYMMFISMQGVHFLKRTKQTGYIATVAMGVVNGIIFILPVTGRVYFYDLLPVWAIAQSVVNLVLFICFIREYVLSDKKERWISLIMLPVLTAFELDLFATCAGWWKGGMISKHVFFVLFIIALFVVLRIIPEGVKEVKKAKDLEMEKTHLEAEKKIMESELKDSRISLMLSQIQPHFIYNTLGTIERMCLKDPEKAFDLVRNFSLYLRGNFSEIDSVVPIRFAEELKHVEYYVNIEKVRFPDMDIRYHTETTDFVIPALSVQPLVENAIKHGLMRLESGGTVVIHSYETPTHFCVEVNDDGVGFDTTQPVDAKKHVGLRNIRGRLKAMVNGDLVLESKPNEGTKATIMIPKEVTE